MAQPPAGFNYNTQNWSSEILKATNGKGVDIIVDFVGASYFQVMFSFLPITPSPLSCFLSFLVLAPFFIDTHG